MAHRVNSVSKKHNSLSTGDGLELFSQNICNRVIEPSASTGASTTNRFCDHVSIGCRFAQHVDSVVKRHYHYAVRRLQLVNELDSRILNLVQTKASRTACID